jgi:hypothetical protein
MEVKEILSAVAQYEQAKKIEEGKKLWEKWTAARGGL